MKESKENERRKVNDFEKKIEQLLKGNFEYEQPPLLFSKEKITMTMKAGGDQKRRGVRWNRG